MVGDGQLADWGNRDNLTERMVAMTRDQLRRGVHPSVHPFHTLTYPISAAQQLAISRIYADEARRSASPVPLLYVGIVTHIQITKARQSVGWTAR